MKKALALVVLAVALTGCTSTAAQPLMAPQGQPSAEPSESASAEPTETPHPTGSAGGYPDADEDAFLALVHRDWQPNDAMPSDDRLVALGYELCDAGGGQIGDVAVVEPGWSGTNNIVVHTGAGYHLCPAD